jgi:hypothetical protein
MEVPMKAGEIKQVLTEFGGANHYVSFGFGQVIAPGGLPEQSPSLAARINPSLPTLVAPVTGVYYVMATPYGAEGGRGKVHVWTSDLVAEKLVPQGNGFSSKHATNAPGLWELNVKAGDLLKATAAELYNNSQITLANEPDFSKYDLSKPETNPFFPHPEVREDPAFDTLPAREGDSRIVVFKAKRDAKLWISSNCAGPTKVFTLNIEPAAAEFVPDHPNSGNLRIADTDYWAFDAKAGDVMALNTTAAKFKEMLLVRDPDLTDVYRYEARLDQSTDGWRMIVQKPGRYLLAVSCLGNGGSGEYSLGRKVFHAKEFSRSQPAKGEISAGEVQVWTFKAIPSDPLFIHWMSSNRDYEISVYDEKGQRTSFERQEIDRQNSFGILKVNEPRTFVIVLSGNGNKSSYSIELGSIPGYQPTPAVSHRKKK